MDRIMYENYLEQIFLEDEMLLEEYDFYEKSWKDSTKSEKISRTINVGLIIVILGSCIALSTFYIKKGTNEKQKEYCRKSIKKSKEQIKECKRMKNNGEMTEKEYRKHLSACKTWVTNLEKILKEDKATLRYHHHINKLMKLDEKINNELK